MARQPREEQCRPIEPSYYKVTNDRNKPSRRLPHTIHRAPLSVSKYKPHTSLLFPSQAWPSIHAHIRIPPLVRRAHTPSRSLRKRIFDLYILVMSSQTYGFPTTPGATGFSRAVPPPRMPLRQCTRRHATNISCTRRSEDHSFKEEVEPGGRRRERF
ncbi:hypothetical protein BJV77DRAFT_152330 [Russula vinacea]|nr:hypothetical protein BJV77DRAFT_152330 [Russula vinacea]